jgi:osmotically-inducible protein OsmY
MKNSNMKNDPEIPPASTGLSLERDEKTEDDLEDAEKLAALKDKSRLNITGSDNDMATDILDALGQEMSLSAVVKNIEVTVEGEIVTLKGKVDTEREIMIAGDVAITFAGEGNLNNYLSIEQEQ